MAADTPPLRTRSVLLFIVAGVMAVFFAIWTPLANDRAGSIFAFDQRCADFWKEYGADHGASTTWQLMKFLTDLGSVATMSMVALMGGVWQFSHRRRAFGTAWFAIVVGGAIMNQALKVELDRPRPPEPDRAVLETNASYPSGHAMGSVIGYGMLCYALLRQTRFPLRRTAIVMFFVVFTLGIGLSRVYLRAHWFSDVIAGYAAGLCWLSFWLAWIERRRSRKSEIRISKSETNPKPE
jgi:undecaprenyl-diphosphatase